MKLKKSVLVLFLFISAWGYSQPFNNSWIDYSKTYYKFTVGKDGLYRISQSVLNSVGLANVPAEQFQLWRNGEEEIIYTSKASGALGASDYIEFWGKMNDGKKDTKLYRIPDYQLSDYFSLQTDTAAYYLTVNATGNNLKLIDAPNNITGTLLTPEPYFMNTRGEYFRDQLNPGYGNPAGVYVYSSSYDIGEGWVSNYINPNRPLPVQLNELNLYAGGPAATVRFGVVGSAYNNRNLKVKMGNTYIFDESMPYFNFYKKELPNVPLSLFNASTYVRFSFESTSSVYEDRAVVSHVEINYPSAWNFNNKTNFYFELPASVKGNYLVIDNFNSGGIAPVLMDMSNYKRYVGDVTSTPGKVKFVLPPSTFSSRKFILVSEAANTINSVSSLQKRTFINYADASLQGNYLIITHPALFTSTSGANNVNLYKDYRSSAAGGGYNTKVIDINELVDQFGFGIKKHPSAIRDFIQYAYKNYAIAPKFIFLIGKGITYDDYVKNPASNYVEKLNLVPTFGSPASDVLLSAPHGSIVPSVPIGRLSAISGDEVGQYLQKMKEYESVQQSTEQTVGNKKWMKNVIQIVGGQKVEESDLFRRYMNTYKGILEDTAFGGHIELFSKTSNSAVQLISSQRISELFKEGIGLISYFGHSSANTLEYNLGDPTAYNNPGKYPFFLVSGCTAGNNYIFDTLRFTKNSLSISENFVLSSQRGSIAMLASTHYGVAPYLDEYNLDFYNQMANENYGGTVGDFIKTTIKQLNGDNPNISFLSRTDMEEMTLHGDPAIRVYPHAKPDYVVEESDIKINPAFISVSEEKFVLDAKAFNIGKAVSDSITFQVKRTYPDGTTDIILQKRVRGIYFSDSIHVIIPIISTRDKGLNKITITIDAGNDVAELSESNNIIVKEIFIYEDEARPAFPNNYAIINKDDQTLWASTANPLSVAKDYVMEIDTTLLFNSSLKITRSLNSAGGAMEFNPGFNYTNNTVYYWRVAVKPASGLPSDYHWNSSSFIYIANSSEGSNQSHYYQHLKSDTLNIKLDSSRKWTFATIQNNLYANMEVYRGVMTTGAQTKVSVNGANIASAFCAGFPGIVFTVIDPVSLKPWANVSGATGLYGSAPVCQTTRSNNFQFNNLNQVGRKKVMDFMDIIPDNFIVFVRYVTTPDSASNKYANEWASDTTVYGSGISMYHKLKDQGFSLIDSFYRPRTFVFMYQKNNPAFGPDFIFSEGIFDNVELLKYHSTPDTLGIITSPKFGPAKAWKEMHWRGSSLEANSPDAPTVQVIGIDMAGNGTILFNVDKSKQDVDISSVSASQYPFIQLRMNNLDSVSLSPYQLSYWRLNYLPAPEGALTPSLFFNSKDSLEQGELLQFGVAFKNISHAAFDSLKVKLSIIDNNNVTYNLPITRQKPLLSGDTIIFKYTIDTKKYPGANTLFVNFNPDNDQPEEYLYNNFLYKNFYVKPDNFNPLLDVTFDGVHILNRDIVSARPHILIKLKDESKNLVLGDTSLLKVQIRYPDGTLKDYRFDNDTVEFIPANLASGDNTATIDFSPQLSGDDDEYELVVSGKDVVGNKAGQMDYHIKFRVISKPMISNLLNYPNPFTTSTAFVFTVTGSVVPQNIRIQILTVTGKVIREITKEELGPLHIGRNITEFKWDGSDMYGQKVANGVYLYRVLTNLNGKSLERFKDDGDNTDQYFTKGYGKMYFMR